MNDAEFLSKSSLSDAASYAEIGECWDHHSLAEVWDQTEPVPVIIKLHAKRHASSAATEGNYYAKWSKFTNLSSGELGSSESVARAASRQAAVLR